jgi:hypothetical protein
MTDPLSAMAARAEREPFFLASVLAMYRDSKRLDEAGLADALGCRREDLLMLRLCRAPRTDGPGFREDIDCIAGRFGIDPQRLASVVKRGRVVARLQDGPASAREDAPTGWLMAARDREDEREDVP